MLGSVLLSSFSDELRGKAVNSWSSFTQSGRTGPITRPVQNKEAFKNYKQTNKNTEKTPKHRTSFR